MVSLTIQRQDLPSSKCFLFLFKVSAGDNSHCLYFLAICDNQTPRVLKRIGGHWDWRQVDGDKFICLDHILARDSGPCIIYSFGIANDWEFEDQMDSLGEDWTDG